MLKVLFWQDIFMKDLFTDKWFLNNFFDSNDKKRKMIIIMYLKIVKNDNTMKLALFSTLESNSLTNKNVAQITKTIKWTKKLKLLEGLIQ